MFGLNYVDGGDGSSKILGTYTNARQVNRWQMSAAEVRKVGSGRRLVLSLRAAELGVQLHVREAERYVERAECGGVGGEEPRAIELLE